VSNSHIRAEGRDIVVSGGLIRTARIDGDSYRFMQDPAPVLAALRNCGSRIDIFSFMQRLPDTSPLYRYPMEWDNFAVLEVRSFQDWWNKDRKSVV